MMWRLHPRMWPYYSAKYLRLQLYANGFDWYLRLVEIRCVDWEFYVTFNHKYYFNKIKWMLMNPKYKPRKPKC